MVECRSAGARLHALHVDVGHPQFELHNDSAISQPVGALAGRVAGPEDEHHQKRHSTSL
jgi:hypothetical protein